MKHKTQITAILLLICILLTPALTSSASAHDYDHVYNDITIITPDSFEDVFGETEVDRVAYTYEMVDISNSHAVVAMEIEIKIGHDYYTSIVSGTVNAYTLPSGDTLYEGPIRGIIMIQGEEYRFIIGFTKLSSLDDVIISATLQNETRAIILRCGEKNITEEVINYFTINLQNKQPYYINDNTINENAALDVSTNLESPISTSSAVFPPTIIPITHPGGGDATYPDLGTNGVWGFQDRAVVKHYRSDGSISNYEASETRVYFNSGMNIMLVTLKPYSNSTRYFLESEDYIVENVELYSLEVKLETIETDATESGYDYAYIAGFAMPFFSTQPNQTIRDIILYNLILDSLNLLSIPTNTLDALKENIGINATGTYVLNSATLTITMAGVPGDITATFDTIHPGVPFKFQLTKGSTTSYVGDTNYKVTSKVTYKVFTIGGDSIIFWDYVDHISKINGSIDLT